MFDSIGAKLGCEECHELILWLRELYTQSFNTTLGILIWAICLALVVLGNFYAGTYIVERCMVNRRCDPIQPGYGANNGPHTWNTEANNQSPINIDSDCAERISLGLPLVWDGYNVLPKGFRLENNGQTLLLHAAYEGETPCLLGADLLSSFHFREISFRWSWHDIGTGSEHTLNNRHFPLEMQCLHTDTDNSRHTSSRSLLMVSYLFEVSEENPFLNVIVQYLVAVQHAGQCIEIPPFPLSYLMPPFYSAFYSYHGSLTEPPCHRGAEWLINPLPLAISERQLHEFRKLRSRSGARIGRNARPVQPLGDRVVKFNSYRQTQCGDGRWRATTNR